jgi:outer membrane receptor for ferrienterochelin and colicins
MKILVSCFLFMVFGCKVLCAQSTLRLRILNVESREPLLGASVKIIELDETKQSDSTGMVSFQINGNGIYTLQITYVGYAERKLTINAIQISNNIEVVLMEENEEEEEEVVVTATRISRTISNTPTRTEVISGEELTEKGNMKPGDIRMMLNESTGIQTQQTSATSFNAGIRIQGLDGRYTQILRDGYPLYGGFAGSLSLLQIAPLDLEQVEVIKGAASTLFGGGAIAGLVNLVSKKPTEERKLNFLANATTAGGLDLSGFYSEKFGKAGVTMFASRNSNAPFDPASINLTAIPKFERYTVNPRLFLYGEKTTADLGFTYITEDRTGGSIDFIKNGNPGFFEINNSDRFSTQFGVTHRLNQNASLQFKNSFSRFNRILSIPSYTFNALQASSFSELTWNKKGHRSDWVIGTNVVTEELSEKRVSIDPKRDYRLNTLGVFLQHVLTANEHFVVESGLRLDHVNDFGIEVLPRLSAMLRLNPALTTRIGGGFGYKPPSIFTEEAERQQFRNLLPIDRINSINERSKGFNWDLNYNTKIGKLGISINQLFFYTRLDNPLVLRDGAGNNIQFENAEGYLDTKGIESNFRFTYDDLKLFVGYTYTDANTHFSSAKQWLPLTARHRLNNVLMYEIEEKFKIGLEAYYFSKQKLNDNSVGRSYWTMGLMAEKIWERWSIFINFENFTDTRQSKFDPIFTGTLMNPQFRDIYAPVEGFVVNGGIKILL